MTNVVRFPGTASGRVSQVSVQVSMYSEKNGGVDPGERALYPVEVLFPDGTWEIASHFYTLADAKLAASLEAEKRDAVLLEKSFWPTRQVE
ncbi:MULTISPECIES: hypothetical protein [Sulfitobacter]|uniref:hypothetical protein n=1 Tax=Sulfitobacter TaxID=60136 RepID=UPI0024554A46|nr:hypothetical protein [Sulfitobacter faviae]MDH4541076.1 hypothetical protein [Sulfitobacter faviae]